MFLTVAALILAQSLLRDLWLLSRLRRSPTGVQRRAASCMCVESTVGLVGVLIGSILLGAGGSATLRIQPWGWAALVGLAMSFAFLLKDFVIEWKPWRIVRDKDHVNIAVVWKR